MRLSSLSPQVKRVKQTETHTHSFTYLHIHRGKSQKLSLIKAKKNVLKRDRRRLLFEGEYLQREAKSRISDEMRILVEEVKEKKSQK